MNRVGREAWRSGSWASRLRTYRHGLRLVAAQRKRDGEFATGLDWELTGRTTALPQRGFCFCPWRFGLDGQRLALRSRLHEIQAWHRCGTGGQHEATYRNGNDSAHDRIPPPRRHGAASPPEHDIELQQPLRVLPAAWYRYALRCP